MTGGYHWKERLGFVSGTIVVWALAVVGLWPTVAMFQTGLDLHLWTVNLPGEDPQPGLMAFGTLTLILALGIGSLLLSGFHMFARGLWLGLEPVADGDATAHPFHDSLDRVAGVTYRALLLLWLFVLIMLPALILLLLGTMLEQGLRTMFASSSAWLRLVANVPIVVIVSGLAYFAWRRIRRGGPGIVVFFSRLHVADVLTFVAVMVPAVLLVTEACFTVDLDSRKTIVEKSRDPYVLATVRLGGAASDVRRATLELHRSGDPTPLPVAMTPLEDGVYDVHIPSRGLADGLYRLVLSYPRASFGLSYPYLHTTTVRTRSFVVVP